MELDTSCPPPEQAVETEPAGAAQTETTPPPYDWHYGIWPQYAGDGAPWRAGR